MSGDRSRRTHNSRPWFPAAKPCRRRSRGRRSHPASGPLQDIGRRQPHRRNAVGTRLRNGESRSSWSPCSEFVICSVTNSPQRLQHLVGPGRRGIRLHGETLTFTNSALKKFTQPFYPGPDGSFGQTYTDEGGRAVHYHGRIVGDVIDADAENPPCEYHWHLKKQ